MQQLGNDGLALYFTVIWFRPVRFVQNAPVQEKKYKHLIQDVALLTLEGGQ